MAVWLIIIAIFAMMIAFVAGVAVVSSKPLNLFIAVGVSLVFVSSNASSCFIIFSLIQNIKTSHEESSATPIMILLLEWGIA